MLAVVNQPPINDFKIEGTVEQRLLDIINAYFGPGVLKLCVQGEESEEDGGWERMEDMDWYKETEKELTPAVSMRFYRQLHKLTQSELAGKLGVSKQHVSDMECGRRNISKKTAEALSAIFDVPAGRFL